MNKILTTIALVCAAVCSFAQNPSIVRPRIEIAEAETGVEETVSSRLEVFYMNDEDPRMYYLSLGNLGIGNDLVQIDFDQVYELFIPLGGTLEEAIAKMEEISQALKNAAPAFETCYAKTSNEDLKGAAADFLKRVYFALRNEGDEYKAAYEKYNAIVGGE